MAGGLALLFDDDLPGIQNAPRILRRQGCSHLPPAAQLVAGRIADCERQIDGSKGVSRFLLAMIAGLWSLGAVAEASTSISSVDQCPPKVQLNDKKFFSRKVKLIGYEKQLEIFN